MAQYHGIKPPTTDDAKMALSHLNRTQALNTSKIAEHERAKARAKKVGNKASVRYNDSHLTKHKQDNDKVMTSKKTLAGLRGRLMPLVNQMDMK